MSLYRQIVLAVLIVFFAGCSAPKSYTKPQWSETEPRDLQHYYSVGEAKNLNKAKNIAVFALRRQLNETLDNSFKELHHPLFEINKARMEQIFQANEHLSKTIPMRGLKIVKTSTFKGRTLVLISLSKKDLFEYLQNRSSSIFEADKKVLESSKNLTAIQKFITIKPLLKKFATLASSAQLKKNTLQSYNPFEEFHYLKKLDTTYDHLRASISFYVLGDAASKIFTQVIKQSIKDEGLTISKRPLSDDALKIILNTTTTNTQEYTFNKSSSLVHFSTYNLQKEKVASKQHTFVGKSRKNHKDAKEQAALHMYAKTKKFGVFQFLGLQR